MAGAFDGGAFDSVAFDVSEVIPEPIRFGGGYLRKPYKIPVILDDDDDILLVWFMLMRQ